MMMMMRCNGFPAMPPDGGSATYLQQLNVVCRGVNKNENEQKLLHNAMHCYCERENNEGRHGGRNKFNSIKTS